MTELDESVSWKGDQLDCASCENRLLESQGRCRLMQACVHDRYAKRIDRFFERNQEMAKDYLAHPYFEVRAVAAKHADIFHLPPLVGDPDETVRWSAANRLPMKYLMMLRNDPNREVRIRVAGRLEESHLGSMIQDPDYYVRQIVARRLPVGMLVIMMHDSDREVRLTVAKRIGREWLVTMSFDEEPSVRLEVAKRIDVGKLSLLMNDPDWRVRYEVANRIHKKYLVQMLNDDDPLVSGLACDRLEQRNSVTPYK